MPLYESRAHSVLFLGSIPLLDVPSVFSHFLLNSWAVSTLGLVSDKLL